MPSVPQPRRGKRHAVGSSRLRRRTGRACSSGAWMWTKVHQWPGHWTSASMMNSPKNSGEQRDGNSRSQIPIDWIQRLTFLGTWRPWEGGSQVQNQQSACLWCLRQTTTGSRQQNQKPQIVNENKLGRINPPLGTQFRQSTRRRSACSLIRNSLGDAIECAS